MEENDTLTIQKKDVIVAIPFDSNKNPGQYFFSGDFLFIKDRKVEVIPSKCQPKKRPIFGAV